MREAGDQFLDIDGSEESHRQCLRPRVLCYYDLRHYFIATGADACVLQPLEQQRPSVTNNYIVLRKRLGTLRQRANAALLRLRETGVLRHLYQFWFADSRVSCAAHWTEGLPMSAGDTQAVLMVAPLGCILGLLLLLLERAIACRRPSHRPTRRFHPPSQTQGDRVTPVVVNDKMSSIGAALVFQNDSRPARF
ncbi:hypothetical protein FJT64_021849 [Amphibalanus amphitrite]|uniref:Uncharacterized protein n=2 Tax=Amphibalanus amphitrite TaxID=1232801 RepID=A0A6A4WKT0_AMPAM|nr:hypothetical protein FJT64_021849 [Amphibalanus amphitrite]